VVEQTGVEFVDLHNITADKYDKMGERRVAAFFNNDHTHSSLKGAKANAQSVRTGLHQIHSSLARYLK
jgi:hypothetical protein